MRNVRAAGGEMGEEGGKKKREKHMKHQMTNSGNRRCHGKAVAVMYS